MSWPQSYLDFIHEHRLPESYLTQAAKCFEPVVNRIAGAAKGKKPLLIGLNGSQGSGKTTLADYLQCAFQSKGLKCLSLSIDDFYLSKAERAKLSETVHPLLAVRGVPGTHNTSKLKTILDQLRAQKVGVSLPKFNKANDDLFAESAWPEIQTTYDIVILEGWFWGAKHCEENQLTPAANRLEAEEDPDAVWRRYSNQQLKDNYQPLYELFDYWLMLKAPSFECVADWRLQQENKLRDKLRDSGELDKASDLMSEPEVQRFVQFYESITRRLLDEMPAWADVVWNMDEHRTILSTVNRLKEEELKV